MKATPEWWKAAFERGWYPLGSIVSEWAQRTQAEVQSLKKILILPRGSRILDVGCGVGRHTVALAKLGYQVTGLDISPKYLRAAESLARKNKVEVRLVRSDMRQIPFKNEFEGALNLFSSFGYFARASDDAKVLTGIFRALAPGGIFVIDNMNLDFVRKNHLPQAWFNLSDGTLVLEQRYRLKPGESVVKTDWLFVSPRGERTKMESTIRGYTRNQMASLFRKTGFTRLRFHPALSGKKETGKYSYRTVLSGKKPT